MTQLASVSLDRHEAIVIASISGEIDLSNAEDFGARILRWITNGDSSLVLDLTKMSYCDSAGINLVFSLEARLREHGQDLRIVLPADSQPRRTFAIVGVDAHVPILETIEEAERAERADRADRADQVGPGPAAG